MDTSEKKITKPASEDPWREAKGHPNGPSLMEMLNGQEERKLRGETPAELKQEEEQDKREDRLKT